MGGRALRYRSYVFCLAIAISTYFQKIADPKDLASSAGVSFTINHIAAVVIPAALGLVWVVSPSLVFHGRRIRFPVAGGRSIDPGLQRPEKRL